MSEHEQEEKQEKREKSEEEQEARTHARKSKNPTERCGEKFGKEWWGSEGENGKGIEWGQCGRSAEGGGGGGGGRGEGGAGLGHALEAS